MAACRKWMFLLLLLPFFCGATTMPPVVTDVLVIGGGASGVAAGIQSARMGAQTIIAEETPWLGGMLSAAGVSATDGNHMLPSALWRSAAGRYRVGQQYSFRASRCR